MSTDAAPPRLEMRGIKKSFGPTVALAGVDLVVAPGEVHALVGENGAGKSTLMKVLSGALTADAGQMWLDGKPYLPAGPLDARRQGVVMIYQELALAPHLSVEDNILLGQEPCAWGLLRRSEMRRRTREALEKLEHPELNPDTPVGDLSPGMQQLVEIARALAVHCRMLVLDEPTSSLSRDDMQHLFALIERLRGQGLAIVYISHFLEEVQSVAERFTVLRDGATVGGGLVKETKIPEIVALMVGRNLTELFPHSQRTPGDVILDLRELSGPVKPEDATLSLRRGEVLGIAGLVGAGRTELLRTVFGLDAVRRGEVRLGAYVGPASPARRWAQGMGFLSEDRKNEGLALGLSVGDNMTLSQLRGFGPAGLVLPGRQAAAVSAWVEKLSIRCRSGSQPISDLSGGNQQKVALARLLHHGVDVLLLDEPTRGIDVGSKAQIYKLIDELALAGKAVLLVSSYLPELLGICDRIAVMCRGRLLPARPVTELDEHSLMLEATGGEAA
ncbi:MAG: sugar ABC transporter ATP-binding protein [Planctomycetota bacterium]|nr:sugar ABC transporter ATP-binding protein [Planctomycetota bacterium]